MGQTWLDRLKFPYFKGEKVDEEDFGPAHFPEKGSRLYLDIVLRRADIQISQIDAIDSKVSSVFAASSAILPITLGVYSLRVDDVESIPFWSLFLMLLSIAAYLGCSFVFLKGYWPKPWDTRPEVKQWVDNHSSVHNYTEEHHQAWLVEGLVESIKTNSKSMDRKIILAKWSVGFLIFEVVTMTIAIVLPLFSKAFF